MECIVSKSALRQLDHLQICSISSGASGGTDSRLGAHIVLCLGCTAYGGERESHQHSSDGFRLARNTGATQQLCPGAVRGMGTYKNMDRSPQWSLPIKCSQMCNCQPRSHLLVLLLKETDSVRLIVSTISL